MRHRKSAESCLGFGADTGRSLVSNFAPKAGRRARKRRDGGRMIVCFYLDHIIGRFPTRAIVPAGASIETPYASTVGDGRIVGIRDHRALRADTMGVANHGEQRMLLALAVDNPIRVKDLVPAMLGIGFRRTQ